MNTHLYISNGAVVKLRTSWRSTAVERRGGRCGGAADLREKKREQWAAGREARQRYGEARRWSWRAD